MSGRRQFARKRYSNRRVESATSLLDQTFKAFNIKDKIEGYSGFPHWQEIVGDEIAKVAIPEKIVKKKILVVRVIDPTWIQELSLQKNVLLSRLHALNLGYPIEDIRFTTGNPRDFPFAKNKDSVDAKRS